MSDYERITSRKDGKLRVDFEDSTYAFGTRDEDALAYKIMRCALERLAELEDQIESGTLVELPCKVGQECWYVDRYIGIKAGKVVHLKISEYSCDIFTTILKNLYFKAYEIGDVLFFDKSQAEIRLAELKGV